MSRFLLIPLISLLLGATAFAQSHTSAEVTLQTIVLTGTVYDFEGSVIARQAKVVAYDKAGRKFETATNDEGVYQIQLPLAPYKMPAVYKIEVTAPGFCMARVERYKIVKAPPGKMSLDFVLDIWGAPDGCSGGHEIQIPDKPGRNRKSKTKPIAK